MSSKQNPKFRVKLSELMQFFNKSFSWGVTISLSKFDKNLSVKPNICFVITLLFEAWNCTGVLRSSKDTSSQWRLFWRTLILVLSLREMRCQCLLWWREIYLLLSFHRYLKPTTFSVKCQICSVLNTVKFLERAGTLDQIRRTEKLKNWRTELLTLRPNK